MGSFAVAVVRVKPDEDVANRGSGTIVQVGSGAPEFDERWGVELVRRSVRGLSPPQAVEDAGGADVVDGKIGEQRRRMANGARGCGAREEPFASFGRRG